ncbi:hypothetical protein M218_32205 [Burkholderia pseudomallei MSHR338]|nr:hypothetical protein M218_32205 [Burkholderia pseudomallei MSHR338]
MRGAVALACREGAESMNGAIRQRARQARFESI